MNKLKKPLKYILSFALPVIFVLGCFGLVWFQYLQDVPLKSKSRLLNDRFDSLSSPIESGSVFTQEVTVKGSIHGFGINFNVIDSSLDGLLKVKVTNKDNGETLLDYRNNFAVISPVSYTCFTLDKPIEESGNHNLTISVSAEYITPEVTAGQMLSLKKSSATADNFGQYSENGNFAEGSLAMLVISDMVGDQPIKYYWFTGIFAAVAAGFLAVLFAAMPKKKTVAVFLSLLVVSSLYHLVLPVYSAPDEITHLNTAYRESNKLLGFEYKLPDQNILKRDTDKVVSFTSYTTNAYTYRYIVKHLDDKLTPEENNTLEAIKRPYLKSYKLPYMLPAASISLSRMLKINGVITAMVARAVNMLIYCVFTTLAWYFIPFGKTGLLAVALLPMTIHTGTSLSYDSFIISFAFLVTALMMNCIFSKEKINIKKLAALLLLCILMTPAKVVYALLIIMVLFIPDDKFESKKHRWVYKALVFCLCGVHYLRYNSGLVKSILESIIPQASARTVTDTVAVAAAANPTVENFTVGYMLSHPGVLLKLVINTFFTKFTFMFNSIIGGTLGYLNLSEVNINPLIITAFTVVLIIAFIPHKDDETVNISLRLACLAIFGGTLAMIVGACITWTPMDYDYIWGFQGRYLLPVLPVLGLGLQSKALTKTKDLTYPILSALITLNILTVLNSFIVIFSR